MKFFMLVTRVEVFDLRLDQNLVERMNGVQPKSIVNTISFGRALFRKIIKINVET